MESPATRRRVWKASEEKTTMNIMESPATMMRRLRHAEDAYDGRWADDAEEAANAAFAAMGAEVERLKSPPCGDVNTSELEV